MTNIVGVGVSVIAIVIVLGLVIMIFAASIFVMIMASGEQLRKGVGVSQDSADVPAYFEDFQDYKDFCISYRGDLARIVKLTSGLLPEQALAAASRRLQHALHQSSTSSVPASVSALPVNLVLFCSSRYASVMYDPDMHLSDTSAVYQVGKLALKSLNLAASHHCMCASKIE